MTLSQLVKILESAASFCDAVYSNGAEAKSCKAFDLYEQLTSAAAEVGSWLDSESEPK